MNIEKWERTRSKGKAWYLWVVGFLAFGITTAVTFSILMHFLEPQEPIWLRPVIALLVNPPIGLIWAQFMWKRGEKKYAELTARLN